jgi:pantoate--beta-alanine ligase
MKEMADQGKSIGFVPTMGALHEGHLSLVRQAKAQNDVVVCSIFVNPTQFNDLRDFEKYPRTIESDKALLISAGCDVLFAPRTAEVYPVPDTVRYNLGRVAEMLEGAHRPGHFNGVASVVKRLFEAVCPHRAYFGLKDYQQFLVIKALVHNYSIPVEVVGCETVRDTDGLAMSSRNALLDPLARQLAVHLHKALLAVQTALPTTPIPDLERVGLDYLVAIPEIQPEYVAVVHAQTLEPANEQSRGQELRALIAAKLGGVRLIDNVSLGVA